MELKTGYKQTEVGVIPEDWIVEPIFNLVDTNSPICYGVVQVGGHSHDGVPIVAIKNVKEIGRTAHHLASREIEAPYARSRVRPGDVLISVKGTIGRVGIVPNGFVGNISRELARLRIKEGVCADFVAFQLEGISTQDRISKAIVGTTRLEFSIGHLRNFQVALPADENEQHAIADMLSDIDATTLALETLIAKKKGLKQAAMQELLTGKRRLPGFEGEWEAKRLGELGEIRSGGTPSTNQPAFWDGGIPWCTPTDITALDGRKYLTTTARTISPSGLQGSSAEVIPPHSLIMTTRATIGECAINTLPMTTNQGFKNIVPSPVVATEFLYYLMSTQKQRLISLCGGSTFLEIGKKELSGYELSLPLDRNEQDAIASILSKMDEELQSLEANLAKAVNLKQGMMQQLLTGKIRLK